jgi:hypothetical protein
VLIAGPDFMLDRQPQSSVQSPCGALGGEGAAIFLTLVGAALVCVDGLLEGMIGAGLGLEAISAYLGCARTHILDEMAAREIVVAPEQLEKPLRARKNAWSAYDQMLLIAGWVCDIPVAVIAELVGRTRGAVYGKRRRVGLAPRRRISAEQSIKATRDAQPVRRAARPRRRPAVVDPPCREPVPARTALPQGGPQRDGDDLTGPGDSVDTDAAALVAVIGGENPRVDGVADLQDSGCPTALVVAHEVAGGDVDLTASADETPAVQRAARARRAKKSPKISASASTFPPRALEPAVATAIAAFQERQCYKDLVLYGRHKNVGRTVEMAVRALGGQMVASMVDVMGERSESTVKSYLLKMHLSTAKKLLAFPEFDDATFRQRLDGMYRPHFSTDDRRLYFRNDRDRLRHCKLREENARRNQRERAKKDRAYAEQKAAAAPAVPDDVIVYMINNKPISLRKMKCLESRWL